MSTSWIPGKHSMKDKNHIVEIKSSDGKRLSTLLFKLRAFIKYNVFQHILSVGIQDSGCWNKKELLENKNLSVEWAKHPKTKGDIWGARIHQKVQYLSMT